MRSAIVLPLEYVTYQPIVDVERYFCIEIVPDAIWGLHFTHDDRVEQVVEHATKILRAIRTTADHRIVFSSVCFHESVHTELR